MNLAPLPIQKFFANNGRPLAGGRLFTYEAGTSEKVATYTDASGGSQNTNPIVLDFRGECRLWIDPQQSYKFILAPPGNDDPPTNPIWTVDNITAAPQAFDNAAVDAGSVNNVSLTIPQISSPMLFTRVVFKAAFTNTGETTLQINGGTAHNLVYQNGDAFQGGDIVADGFYEAIFTGGEWQLQGPAIANWITEAESAAGITTINVRYPPGDVRRYGADPTGENDSTAAIQAALDCNGEVYLDGKFKASGLFMHREGQKLLAASRGSGLIAASNTTYCLHVAGGRQIISGVLFDSGVLPENDTDTDFVAVLMTYNNTVEPPYPSNRNLVESCTIHGKWTYGISMISALYSCIRDCNIDGFRKRAISITSGGTFNRIEDNMLFESSLTAPVEGIVYIDNSPSNWIVNNHITRGTGVGIKALATVPLNNFLYIVGNDIDFLENYAISVDGFWDVHIESNWCAGGQAEGLGQIVVGNARKLYITNNSVDGTLGDGEGITLIGCSDGVVSGNCVQYSVRNIVLDDCDRILVTNNTSGQLTGLPPTGSVTQYSFFARNQSDTAGCFWLDNTSVLPTVAAYGGIARYNIRESGTLTTRSDGDGYFRDRDVYIGNDDADQSTFRSLHFRTRHTGAYGLVSGGFDDTNRGQIVFDGLGVGIDTCALRFFSSNNSGIAERVQIQPDGHTRPGADNTYSIGTSANRWSVVYAATGAINTSDERHKQDIGAIPDAVLDAWADVEFVQYRWRDAVDKKGSDGARWHFGVVAQRVKEAFEARGLDPFALGILCYDEWEATPERIVIPEKTVVEPDGRKIVVPAVIDQAKAAGNRYGIRYEEALVLEAALMRRALKRMAA